MKSIVIAALGLALSGGAASAQSAAPPPCSGREHRQLDFWVGDWELEFDLPNGQVGRAANRITRDEFGDCAIVEHFVQPAGGRAGGGYVGGSVSMYDAQLGRWRQMWVDNGGSPFVLVGGPVAGQDHVFEMVTTEPRGARDPAIHRMIWQDVKRDSLVWRWQARQADGSWQDRWVLRYRRKGTAQSGGN